MRLLLEILALAVVTLLVGTAFHLARTDEANRIEFVNPDKYPLALVVPKRSDETRERQPPKEGAASDTERDTGSGGPDRPSSGSDTPAGPTVATQTPAGDEDDADVGPTVPPATVESREDDADDHAGHGHDLVPEITSDVAHEEYQAGGVVFVDARRTKEYEATRVAGAVSLSLHEGRYEDQFNEFLNTQDPGLPVIVYCGGGTCEDSHQVALRLRAAGFENVRVMKDGLPGWQQDGYPKEEGPQDA